MIRGFATISKIDACHPQDMQLDGILEASNDGASWTPCNEVNRQDGTWNLANVGIRPIPCDGD